MSRTFRTQPTSGPYGFPPHLHVVRDGYRDLGIELARDHRATGFRDHREFRRRARQLLRNGDDESILAGKRRRYGHRYGNYEW